MRNAGIAALAALMVWAATARSGPVYDPFLESFQVGAHRAGEPGFTDEGWPADALDAARADSLWFAAAQAVLAPGGDRPRDGSDLTLKILDAAGASVEDMRAAVRTVAAGGSGSDTGFLAREAAALGFGSLLASGDSAAAGRTAMELARTAPSEREGLVWRIRARMLGALDEAETAWEELPDLGPFDRRVAWSLWQQRAESRGVRQLTLPAHDDRWRGLAGGIGADIGPDDLSGSGWPDLWQAGLGGLLLPRRDLPAHFARFPDPPDHLTVQGWWIRGQRRMHSGQPEEYERIAEMPGVRPAWRLDLWRRASELRLLDRDAAGAEHALERALELARLGRGTESLRRRLRQWVEQAMVHRLAAGDTDGARRLHHWGLKAFAGDEKVAFLRETRHWNGQLGIVGGPDPAADAEPLAVARHVVETGGSADVTAAGAAERDAFRNAAESDLWELWARWGRELLADSGTPRDLAYVRRLELVDGAADRAAAALDAYAPLLPLAELRAFLVDHDVVLRTEGRATGRPSPVPDLVAAGRGDTGAVHALLGLSLAADDMRGSLAAGFALPQRGLTRQQRRLFLYPLPSRGPVREALLAADNDPALLLAVARNESRFEPAIRSRAGALGWMQIMPFHYPGRGAVPGEGHWSNPKVSIARGDALLSEARRRYGGDPYRVLAAYNAGPEAADRWDRQLGGGAERDIYLAWIGYTETRRYVEKVLVDRELYRGIIRDRAAGRASRP